MLESDHVTVDIRYPKAFDAIVCPVCGDKDWRLIPAEGAFCDECNCHLELGPTNGDPGFIATFNADHCHPSHWDEAPPEKHLIPDDPSHGRKAYAKFMGSDGEYGMYWLSLYAQMNPHHDYDGEWRPAWERDNSEYGQKRWSPFAGYADDDECSPAQANIDVSTATQKNK